jgi:hypothetical protein
MDVILMVLPKANHQSLMVSESASGTKKPRNSDRGKSTAKPKFEKN